MEIRWNYIDRTCWGIRFLVEVYVVFLAETVGFFYGERANFRMVKGFEDDTDGNGPNIVLTRVPVYNCLAIRFNPTAKPFVPSPQLTAADVDAEEGRIHPITMHMHALADKVNTRQKGANVVFDEAITSFEILTLPRTVVANG